MTFLPSVLTAIPRHAIVYNTALCLLPPFKAPAIEWWANGSDRFVWVRRGMRRHSRAKNGTWNRSAATEEAEANTVGVGAMCWPAVCVCLRHPIADSHTLLRLSLLLLAEVAAQP